MKKLLSFAAVAALALYASAEDKKDDTTELTAADIQVAEGTTPRKQVGVWPAYIAICEIPSAAQAPDIVGLRVTVPFSTRQESVTGFDVGLWGRAQYFEGFMCSLLRNDVKDELSGVQVGLYNTAHSADVLGVQVGLWNEAGSFRGFQAGIINTAGQGCGFQVGLVNRCEELYGFQLGLVNVIRDAELKFCPVFNIGF